MPVTANLTTAVRHAIAQHGNLAASVDDLRDDANLYDAGLTSLATVTVMLALEDAFGAEFPESMLSRRTFSSVATIEAALTQFLRG